MDGLVDGKDEIENAIRDDTYFLQCDCIVLKVENTLFSIPRFQLLKHSQPLRDLSPLSTLRSSEKNPFIVDPDISANEFRHFLRIILPSVTEKPETFWTNQNPASLVSKDEWISVLKISTLWRSFSIRNLTVAKLEGLSMTGEEKIILGRKYFISSWVEAGYTQMVEIGDISDEQMDAIGAVESFKLMRIIHRPRRTSLNRVIKENFQEELQLIAGAEKKIRTCYATQVLATNQLYPIRLTRDNKQTPRLLCEVDPILEDKNLNNEHLGMKLG